MSEELVFNITSKKKNVLEVSIRIPCFLCGDDCKGKPPVFDNLQSLKKHTAKLHSKHPLYKVQYLALCKFDIILKHFQPKGEKIQ